MESGIYSIIFKSSLGEFVSGLAVIENGRIHGGNVKYIIKGLYKEKKDHIEAEIMVEHYQGPLDSIFGGFEEYSLVLSGKSDAESFQITGFMKDKTGMKIEVEGIMVTDLINRYKADEKSGKKGISSVNSQYL